MAAFVEGKVFAPPIGVFHEGDEAARFKLTDGVRARADGGLKRGVGEILALPLGLFQHRAQAHDQGKFTVWGVECEFDAARAADFGLRDFGPCAEVTRVADGADSGASPSANSRSPARAC